jgi:2-oxoglutarate dehydrogenase E1 component
VGPYVRSGDAAARTAEGQGPEHSSARLERYLQLCAEQNMQVCVPSTGAGLPCCVVRRCAVCASLIVMSPKSLLRHPLAVSSMDELATRHLPAGNR